MTEQPTDFRQKGVTFRAIVIGLTLIPMNCMWMALTEVIWYTGEPTTLSIFSNVVFILAILVALNMVAARLRPGWELSGNELLVIYVMLGAATAVAGIDMLEVLVPALPFLHRYGPLEQRYGEIIEVVPEWLVVTDPQAIESVYVGQESMYSWANLRPWLGPLFWWMLFTFALCAVYWGLNLVFRKQWTENEKLAYPLIQPPMMMARQTRLLTGSRVFWLGFGIAGGINVVNGLNALYPLFPKIPIVQVVNLQTLFTDRPWSDMGPAWISFYPSIIALAFLIPLDLVFSSCFFFFFWKAQKILASHVGMQGMTGFPYAPEQAAGGYYAIALLALWITRRHLWRVGRLLAGSRVEGGSPWERRESRLAALFILGGGAFLLAFSLKAGMSLSTTLAFFGIHFVLSIAITRMRAELGPPAHDLYPVGAHRQVVSFFGAMNLPRPDLVMFGFYNFFNRVMRCHPMPQGIEGFRIAERTGMPNGRMLAAMLLALAAGAIGIFWALIWSFNRYGMSANASVLAELLGRESWDAVNVWIVSPPRHESGPAVATLVGLIMALGLAALRLTFTWWPLHPVGYAISASWTMERIWFCMLLAWAIKAALLKYGGVRSYQPAVRFFIGLLLGDFLVGCFWYTYGIIMETDVYHFWPY